MKFNLKNPTPCIRKHFSPLSVQVLHFLSAFNRLAFCPSALMETFTPKVIADPDALALKDLLCVLKAYSSLNYDLQHQRQQ